MNVPLLVRDGYEADDIIGIMAARADKVGMETFMVTPDKDFGQLVTEHVKIYKPGRQGSDVEILGVKEICERWGIERPSQVIDILGLMGDAVDNIPGVKGFGEMTAKKLIQEFGSVENLLAHTDQLKGKQKEKLEASRDDAILSKKLATIFTDMPFEAELADLAVKPHDDEALKAFLSEFEFNALGRRLFGDGFKAGRGRKTAAEAPTGELFAMEEVTKPVEAKLTTLADTPHTYHLVQSAEERQNLLKQLAEQKSFCFDLETTGLDPRDTQIVGIAFSWKAHEGWFAHFPREKAAAKAVLEEFREVLTREGIEKIGHNLKFDLSVLLAHGLEVRGPFFDTMLAHSLIDPDQRHGMNYLSETYLRYTPVPITEVICTEKNDLFGTTMAQAAAQDARKVADYAAEDADVTWQLAAKMRPS